MPNLKPHQKDLLLRLIHSRGLPAGEVDGRVLRALLRAELAAVDGDRVVPTRAGRRQVAAPRPPPDRVRLNQRQEDLLRTILRNGGMPAEELDGRVARPLIARGLVAVSDAEILSPTSAARVYFDDPPAAGRRGRKTVPENARAAAIRRAVRRLEAAVPPGSEVLVGNILASADDLVDAFLRHARRLERAS